MNRPFRMIMSIGRKQQRPELMPWLRRFLPAWNRYLLLLWGLTLLAVAPVLAPGYFYSAHDGRHSVFYLTMFDASLRDGALWPRWAMHHIQGYGYPTFIIQAPLGFYLAELFVLLGAGFTVAAKLTWVTGFLVSAWGMYRLVLHWLEPGGRLSTHGEVHRLAALVAGILYIFIPYRFVMIYVRAALNDSLLLAWYPWVFLAFDRLIALGTTSGWQRRLVLAILSLAGLLLTHTFSLLSFTPLLVTFVLFRLAITWRHEEKIQHSQSPGHTHASALSDLVRRTLLAAIAGVTALLLCAVFFFPLLAEGPHLQQQVYVTDTYDYRNHFVHFGQFFSPFWGFGFSDDPGGASDGMGFQIGVMGVLFAIVAIFILVRDAEPEPNRRALMSYLTLATIGLLFLMMPAAALLWDRVSVLSIIQFPWRLLSLSAFTIAALAGLVTAHLLIAYASRARTPHHQAVGGGAAVMSALVIFASFAYINVHLEPLEPWREDGRAIFRFEREHPDMIAYTEWVTEPFTESPMTQNYADDAYVEDYSDDGILERLAIIAGSGNIVSQYSRGSSAGGIVRLEEPSTVRIHLYYFPGWQVTIDGKPVQTRVSDPNGLIEVDVLPGEHRIDARMNATPARLWGSAISWTMLLVAVGLWFWPRRNTPAA